MTYYMEMNSGAVDTLENWQADFEAMLASTTAEERQMAGEPENFETWNWSPLSPTCPTRRVLMIVTGNGGLLTRKKQGDCCKPKKPAVIPMTNKIIRSSNESAYHLFQGKK